MSHDVVQGSFRLAARRSAAPAHAAPGLRLPVVPARGQQHPQLPSQIQRHANGNAFQLPAHLAGFGRGGGQRLPDAVRQKMESALGADFSDVRVHVGPDAHAIGAIAFTHGSNLYFAPGQYDPHSLRGQQLLGHELTHVVQQRAGRVRNPFGSGVAVVQDHALEAEAERMGQRAAAHRADVQAKMAPGAVQRSSPVNISAPIPAGSGRYRLTAAAGGRQVGSVIVHARDKGAVEVTDLGVDQAHREHGIGKMLIASAARTGMRLGRSKVALAAQDTGSGRLTRWYKGMGFAQVGVNRRGYPRLEAPIGHVLAGAVQRRETPTSNPGRLPAQASRGLGHGASASRTIQRMDDVTEEEMAAEYERFMAGEVGTTYTSQGVTRDELITQGQHLRHVVPPAAPLAIDNAFILTANTTTVVVTSADIRQGTVRRVAGRRHDLELIMVIAGRQIGIHLHPPHFGTRPTSGGVSCNGRVGQVPHHAPPEVLAEIYRIHRNVFDRAW